MGTEGQRRWDSLMHCSRYRSCPISSGPTSSLSPIKRTTLFGSLYPRMQNTSESVAAKLLSWGGGATPKSQHFGGGRA